jgi:exopolysaccharide production protein ExoQ
MVSYGSGGARFPKFDPVVLAMSASFIYILCDIIVRVEYNVQESYLDRLSESGDGGGFKYAMYALVSLTTLAVFTLTRRRLNVSPISYAYHLASFWCIASFIWAIEPQLALKRAVTAYLILITFTFAIFELGTDRTIKLLYWFTAFLIVASLITVALHPIPLFAFSIHPQDEGDQAIAGGWRGIMPHKNIAGAIATHGAIIFFFHGVARKQKKDWFLFLLSIALIIGSKSKTSLALLFVAMAFGVLYMFLMGRYGKNVFIAFFAGLMTLGAVFSFILSDDIVKFFSNDLNLTGRVAIWRSMYPYVVEHFWLGSGFGTFWSIGDASPIWSLARTDFVTKVASSHNGYLEILATTGIFGLVLALVALVILPFYYFVDAKPASSIKLNAMLFSIWLFGILQNLSESQFFSPDRQSWIYVVAAITIAYMRRTEVLTAQARNLRSRMPLASLIRGTGGAR